MNDFFFYVYDSETDTTVPVSVEDLAIEDEQELEFIYDDKVRKVWNATEEEWYRAGVKASHDYAALTNILTKSWSGKSIQEYKQFKGLKKENLRDNMTDMELTLNRLAELSATAIAKAKNPKGYS